MLVINLFSSQSVVKSEQYFEWIVLMSLDFFGFHTGFHSVSVHYEIYIIC